MLRVLVFIFLVNIVYSNNFPVSNGKITYFISKDRFTVLDLKKDLMDLSPIVDRLEFGFIIDNKIIKLDEKNSRFVDVKSNIFRVETRLDDLEVDTYFYLSKEKRKSLFYEVKIKRVSKFKKAKIYFKLSPNKKRLPIKKEKNIIIYGDVSIISDKNVKIYYGTDEKLIKNRISTIDKNLVKDVEDDFFILFNIAKDIKVEYYLGSEVDNLKTDLNKELAFRDTFIKTDNSEAYENLLDIQNKDGAIISFGLGRNIINVQDSLDSINLFVDGGYKGEAKKALQFLLKNLNENLEVSPYGYDYKYSPIIRKFNYGIERSYYRQAYFLYSLNNYIFKYKDNEFFEENKFVIYKIYINLLEKIKNESLIDSGLVASDSISANIETLLMCRKAYRSYQKLLNQENPVVLEIKNNINIIDGYFFKNEQKVKNYFLSKRYLNRLIFDYDNFRYTKLYSIMVRRIIVSYNEYNHSLIDRLVYIDALNQYGDVKAKSEFDELVKDLKDGYYLEEIKKNYLILINYLIRLDNEMIRGGNGKIKNK